MSRPKFPLHLAAFQATQIASQLKSGNQVFSTLDLLIVELMRNFVHAQLQEWWGCWRRLRCQGRRPDELQATMASALD